MEAALGPWEACGLGEADLSRIVSCRERMVEALGLLCFWRAWFPPVSLRPDQFCYLTPCFEWLLASPEALASCSAPLVGLWLV